MANTRGVFAIITDGKKLLLSERMDGRGWNLPGGRVEEGESDQAALVREVKEETGLEVEVLHRVGPDHIFTEDTAVAYACKVVGGSLQSTNEAKSHRHATAEEVSQQYYLVPEKEFSEEGQAYYGGLHSKVPLKLVGPEGRLGRTGRMVWDAFSLIEKPIFDQLPLVLLENICAVPPDTLMCRDNYFFKHDGIWRYWPRLDPYSQTGIMEINK